MAVPVVIERARDGLSERVLCAAWRNPDGGYFVSVHLSETTGVEYTSEELEQAGWWFDPPLGGPERIRLSQADQRADDIESSDRESHNSRPSNG